MSLIKRTDYNYDFICSVCFKEETGTNVYIDIEPALGNPMELHICPDCVANIYDCLFTENAPNQYVV